MNPITKLLDLAERGALPDLVLTTGARLLLWDRVRSLRCQDVRAFAESLRRERLAVHTDDANAQHYCLPPRFFELILGPNLKYSCALFEESQSLGAAEDEMLRLTSDRAEIRDGMRVLDLGCGWGSLTSHLLERFPAVSVVAVSNSADQRAYIERRLQKHASRLEVITADINTFQPPGKFDRIVSVEMFEHLRNYELLFHRIREWLNAEGKLFAHIFCHRSTPYLFETTGSSNWMGQYFFTGGIMPSFDLFRFFQNDLQVEESWKVSGTHYAQTAEEWRQNASRNRAEIISLFREVYGSEAERWFGRWYLFFVAVRELFAFRNGEEWFVSHYRFCKAS